MHQAVTIVITYAVIMVMKYIKKKYLSLASVNLSGVAKSNVKLASNIRPGIDVKAAIK